MTFPKFETKLTSIFFNDMPRGQSDARYNTYAGAVATDNAVFFGYEQKSKTGDYPVETREVERGSRRVAHVW